MAESRAPEVDVLTFIEAIKKRSPIYDTSKKNYHDRELKRQLWIGVCKEVYSPKFWQTLSPLSQSKLEKELVKRWSSFRACFRRQFIEDLKLKKGIESTRKRRYIYYNQLKFLLPFCEKRGAAQLEAMEGERGSIEEDDRDSTIEEEGEEITDHINVENEAETVTGQLTYVLGSLKREDPAEEYDEEMVPQGYDYNINNTTSSASASTSHTPAVSVPAPPHEDSGQDDDELFLRSLVPSMKSIKGDDKLELRMKIMQLILETKKSLRRREKS